MNPKDREQVIETLKKLYGKRFYDVVITDEGVAPIANTLKDKSNYSGRKSRFKKGVAIKTYRLRK